MAADIPLRILFKRTLDLVTGLAVELTSLLGTIGNSIMRVSNLTEFHAHTAATLPTKTVLLMVDGQGLSGLFYLDAESISADDGINTVIDADGRHWTRFGSTI